MKNFIPVLILLATLLGGCYDRHSEPTEEPFSGQDNCDLVELRGLCANGCYTIERDMICEARVTSSDRAGNFYRSMVVEDESGAVEILLGIYNSASQYPTGLLVELHLQGLAIIAENGVVRVGLPPQSHDEAPREMESPSVIAKHLVRGNSVEEIEPLPCDIAELSNALCGRFVEVGALRYTPLSEAENGATTTEYYRLEDSDGNVIFAYISPYANFANIELPSTELSLRGILYHESVGGENHFVIKPRYAEDIAAVSAAF